MLKKAVRFSDLTAFSYINIRFFFEKTTFYRGKVPFIFDQSAFISERAPVLQRSIDIAFDTDFINDLARKSGFLQRQSKLRPTDFVDMLVFSQLDHSELSLQDCCNDLAQQHQTSLSKVGLYKRFNKRSLEFLKSVLAAQISMKQEAVQGRNWDPFSRVLIGDSCKFVLPKHLVGDYPGYGSFGKESSMMNIQYAFDIRNGDWETWELTKATQNDQSHSKKMLDDIRENELHIRDLGFVTKPYLLKIVEEEAFFLNRLNPQWSFIETGTGKQTDFKKLYGRMKKGNKTCFETTITITDKKTFDCRLIAIPVPEEVYADRVQKAQKRAKSHGKNITDEYKARCRFSIYVTNTKPEILKAEDIKELYRLRWQIELIFKTWKSVLDVHKVKAVSKERLECQLIAKFIWILLNWKIFHVIDAFIKKKLPAYSCSHWKFFKLARNYGHSLRKVVSGILSFTDWWETFIFPTIKNLLIDDRKGKRSGYQIVDDIFNP